MLSDSDREGLQSMMSELESVIPTKDYEKIKEGHIKLQTMWNDITTKLYENANTSETEDIPHEEV